MAHLLGQAGTAILFVALNFRSTASLNLKLPGSTDGVVCLSLAAYEEEAYIDALVANALHFAEPTTRVVLHLNSETNYTAQALAKWETDRVTVSKERVAVLPFKGSILYAHMINAQTMDRRWPRNSPGGPCAYWVYQASNMMWVRSGFEAEVRKRKFGMLTEPKAPMMCSKDSPFIADLAARRQRYGWSRPESSFYPMEMVRGFIGEMNQHILRQKADSSLIVKAKCFLEEFALQTYTLNYLDISAEELAQHKGKVLTFCHLTYGDKDHDSVPMEEVQAVAEGRPGFEEFYAIKRVNRHLDHPVTKYIVSLAR